MSEQSSTAVAVIARNEIMALNKENPKVRALMANVALAGGITEKDIRRVKNPSGGSLMFEIQSATGQPEYVRDLIGIPIAFLSRRQLWADKGIGSGDAPVCSSNNMIDGVKRRDDKGAVNIPQKILDIAIPGGTEGKCAGCFFDTWDSAVDKDGVTPVKGKRCQEARVIYFLRVGDVLPVKLSIPTGSLGKFNSQMKTFEVPFFESVVKLTLSKEKSQSNVEYAAYNVSCEKQLDTDAISGLEEYRKLFQKLIDNAVAERTDAGDAERRSSRQTRPGRKDEVPDDQKFKD